MTCCVLSNEVKCTALTLLLFALWVNPVWAHCPQPEGSLGISINQIREMGASVRTQDEFLEKLSGYKDHFSVFTFAINSRSALRNAISRDFPGPILASKDGSLLIRWSCDKQSPAYGQVDAFQFIGESLPDAPYETLGLDYRPGRTKVDPSPARCLSCHSHQGGADPLQFAPIWGDYAFWKGMIGSYDDNVLAHEDERVALRRAQQYAREGNLCYKMLPWKTLKNLDPFSETLKGPYLGRPNLIFTTNFAGQAMLRTPFSAPAIGDQARLLMLCLIYDRDTLSRPKLCEPLSERIGRACAPYRPLENIFKIPVSVLEGPRNPFENRGGYYQGNTGVNWLQRSRWIEMTLRYHPRASELLPLLFRSDEFVEFYKPAVGCARIAADHVEPRTFIVAEEPKVCRWIESELTQLQH